MWEEGLSIYSTQGIHNNLSNSYISSNSHTCEEKNRHL